MSPSPAAIAIVPVGTIDTGILDSVAREVAGVFGCRTETVRLLDDVAFAYDPTRDQYHSTAILERLAGLREPCHNKVLAVTEVDLYIPILTFVYGEAQLGGSTCIVSLCRLGHGLSSIASRNNYIERIVKEAVHELGHCFSLRHCPDRQCIMHYCRSIADVDHKSNQLCRYCRVLLDDELRDLGASPYS